MPQISIRVSSSYTDAWSGFTYSDGSNSNTIILFPNSDYYISPVNSYSPNSDPLVNITPYGGPNTYLNFSGCCSGDTFSFWVDNTIPDTFVIGTSYYIKQAISWTNPSDNLCGCFTLVSSSTTSPSYTLYSAINIGDNLEDFIDCSTCETTYPCATSACCVTMQVVQETGGYFISLTPESCISSNYYYTFNNLYGEPMVLYPGKGGEWIISNAASGETAADFNTSTDCPSGSATTNTYTHLTNDSGYLYLSESSCTPPPLECSPMYCIQGTGFDYDDTYTAILGSEYNGTGYWSGQSNGYVIYYSSANTQWCLSTTLGGTCLLSGKSPCTTTCPDLCEHYFYEGLCPSTTTTTTIDCSTFDFSAIFDCEVFPTTTTTTSTSTTTTTTTPPPDPCSGVSISASISAYTTTTTTSTSTTTTTTIYYPCNFSGDVTFNVIDVEIKCPISKEFKDCFDMGGTRYYTNDILTNPLGGDIEVDMVFSALVDGELKCVSYVGINNDVSPINTITLVDGSFGTYPEGCSVCNASTTTTTTIAPTTTTTTTTTIPCYCYALVSSKNNTFTYTDCNGNAQTQNVLSSDGVVFVCSRTEPISDTATGTATLSESCPISSNNCTLPPCYCYTVTNTYGRYGTTNNYIYIDCDGISQFASILYGETQYYCSRIKPTPVNASGFAATLQATNCNSCGVI